MNKGKYGLVRILAPMSPFLVLLAAAAVAIYHVVNYWP